MGNGDDQNAFRQLQIENDIRKSLYEELAESTAFMERPSFGALLNSCKSSIHLFQ